MRARQRPSHLLEGRKSITRDAKPGEKGFDAGLVSACKGVNLRSGGLIEYGFGKARTPDIRLVERAFFGLKLTAARVKPVKGFTRVRPRIARSTRRFGSESRKRLGKASMKRPG
jgi:hypothetical protein